MPVDIHMYSNGEKNMVAIIPPLVGAAVKLAYKPAMKLAKQLAKKYWSKGADKKQIVQEVRDKGILEKFNSFKLKAKPKVDKPTKRPFKKTSQEKQEYWEKGYARRAKKEDIDVAGKTKQEMIDAVQTHSKATRPYYPRVKEGTDLKPKAGQGFKKLQGLKKYAPSSKAGKAHGGSVKKYASGGGIRKANYK